MNLVERVARLLCNGDPDRLMATGGMVPVEGMVGIYQSETMPVWQVHRARARQILEAMRELDAGTAQDVGAHILVEIGDEHETTCLLGFAAAGEAWHGIIDAELAADIEQHGAP